MPLIKKPQLGVEENKQETPQFLQEDKEDFTLNIAEVRSLRDIVKGAGAFAMRELDQSNVESLVCSDPRSWPEILVTKTNMGYVWYDGGHRLHAAKLLGLSTIQACS